jgi:hypothetical protein
VISRVHRLTFRSPILASVIACGELWASSVVAQTTPTAPAEAPLAPAAPTPAAPGPAAPPTAGATGAEPPSAAPAPVVEEKKKGKGKNKGEHGEGDPRTPDKSAKAPEIGGNKAPDAGKNDEDKYGHLEIHGRVFARAGLSTREDRGSTGDGPRVRVNALDLSLPSARIGFEYQSPLKWLSAEMEAELSGKPKLKDAYARARKRWVTVKAGQFKVPISAIELESAFSLPTVDRGLIHDFLTDVLQVGGRRLGMSVDVHDRDAETGLRPTLTLGAFQGSTELDGVVVDIEGQTLRGQSYAARLELKPGDLTFGVSFEHRTGPERVLAVPTNGTPPYLGRPSACKEACSAHYYTFGADAALDTEMSGTGLRLWLDALAGRSWIESEEKRLAPSRALEAAFPVFGTLRGVAAFRIGGMTRRAFYIEPYGSAGVLDPDLSYGKDHLTEWVLGVNVGRWKLARVGLEGNLIRGAERLPADLGGYPQDPDRMSLMLQGAVAF